MARVTARTTEGPPSVSQGEKIAIGIKVKIPLSEVSTVDLVPT